MIGEVDLYGVLVPPLLLCFLLALLAVGTLRRGLARIGFYRFVWHRPLFDLALFVIVLGAAAALLSRGAGLALPSF